MGAALRLETFAAPGVSPAEGRGPSEAEIEELIAKARGAARAEGFEEGAAAAAAAYDSDRKLALERIAEAVEDARFAAEEARRAAIAAIGPLAAALAESVAPALARAGLGAEIAVRAAEAARTAAPDDLEIRVAPEMAADAADALETAGIAARVAPDPDLAPLQARVAWGGGWDWVDLGDAVAQAQAAITAFFTDNERTGTDG